MIIKGCSNSKKTFPLQFEDIIPTFPLPPMLHWESPLPLCSGHSVCCTQAASEVSPHWLQSKKRNPLTAWVTQKERDIVVDFVHICLCLFGQLVMNKRLKKLTSCNTWSAPTMKS